MSRVVRFHRLGGPEVLEIEELPDRPLKEGELRVRVEAIGLNRAEQMYRAGVYLQTPVLPSLNGCEASAVVLELGPGVSGFSIGEPISVIPNFSLNDYGVYAEVAVVPAYAVIKRPKGLSASPSGCSLDGLRNGLRSSHRHCQNRQGRQRRHYGGFVQCGIRGHTNRQQRWRHLYRHDAHKRQSGCFEGGGRRARYRHRRAGHRRTDQRNHERKGRPDRIRSCRRSWCRQTRADHVTGRHSVSLRRLEPCAHDVPGTGRAS